MVFGITIRKKTMRTVIKCVSRIKWIGLLGLIMNFSDWYVWRLFWAFSLLAVVEMLLTLPVYMQSFKQLGGMMAASMKNRPMPDKDNFTPAVRYSLPFHGAWTAVNGGVTKEFSHAWSINSQRYAYDFIILNNEGKSYDGDATVTTSYYCYGKEILAPADGVIVDARTDCPDSKLMGGGKTDPLVKDIRGNYVVIQHAESEYSYLAHLMPGSILVKAGDRVKRKQQIASCGNSGNTSEPHLHFQVQNGKSFYSSAGLPIHFEIVAASPQPHYSVYDPRPVPERDEETGFIARGQRVENE